ncbi:MAG: 50S ribosomal protein L9 [Aestuariivita sp.]|nr:50S ribosomal protein L9 [Aestuariivita sp.]MCY4347800.1 50S ribosomal protein L9 [Aestuariivita sp.]
MQVILLERVPKLGQMGDVVDVKTGFARNFLLPTKKALRANKGNIARFQAEKAQLEARNLETRKEARALAARLHGKSFTVIRSASDGGNLYGSVKPRDVAEAATATGFSLDRKQIVIANRIKELGLHIVTVVLHPEISVQITVNVARTEEEAEIQASGKTIKDVAIEKDAEAAIAISEMFDEIGAAQEEEEEEENEFTEEDERIMDEIEDSSSEQPDEDTTSDAKTS